jgi:hypothetical protein
LVGAGIPVKEAKTGRGVDVEAVVKGIVMIAPSEKLAVTMGAEEAWLNGGKGATAGKG